MLGIINKILKRFIGDKSEKDIAELQPLADKTSVFFDQYKSFSNDQLREKTFELKERIANHLQDIQKQITGLKQEIENNPEMDIDAKEKLYNQVDELKKNENKEIEVILDQILPEAFAVVKDTARRFLGQDVVKVKALEYDREFATTKAHISIDGDQAIWQTSWDAAGKPVKWDMVHYDVQLIGGAALHKGKAGEMQTGEGKTLVATLPVYLNALAGKGVHLVTVNDYLAKRDSEWMAPIYEFHGLTVDCIDKHTPNSDERRKAYLADITFGTNNEFGFDYLRDNMAKEPEHLVQREHHFAIIDEVDSVLIDEARTPLIISGPTPRGDIQEFDELKPKIQLLYNAQKKIVTDFLTEAKKKLKGIADSEPSKDDLIEGGLALFRAYRGLPKNKALIKYLNQPGVKQQLLKTEAFYMQDKSRDMWKADKEMYFTIDEKNNQVDLTEKGLKMISRNMESENFFILPDLASELVDIENQNLSKEDTIKKKDILMTDYSIKSSRIHTLNQLLKAYSLFEKEVEYVVMNNKVMIVDEQTGRIMDGRRYSDGLHQAIEAKENVKVEAATQTYATVTLQNYFRMYHKLAGMTGTAETEAGEFWEIYKLDVMSIPTNRPIIRDDKDDVVYKTKREKYNAVIEEIVSLRDQGRPVLVGTTTVEVSELLGRMLNIRKIDHQILNAKMHQREADIVANAGNPGTITIATNMAGRGTDIKLTDEVKRSGGLAIIGTERHDSRRVDRQLRGRSGRQGDTGSSQFFVSLDDDLMRLFGSDKIAKMMDRMGHVDGDMIQHGMISKSIERAQKKVEENNFGVRKRLLEYDDVMNSQREVIYKRRKHALYGEKLKLDIANMLYDLSESIVTKYKGTNDFENFKLEVIHNFGMDTPVQEEDFLSGKEEDLSVILYQATQTTYERKMSDLAVQALPIIKQVYEDESNSYKKILVPFTDGKTEMQIAADLELCYNTNGKELVTTLEKNVILTIIDDIWKDHLRNMDDLRSNVQFASHEQKDPLLIYKFESYEMFKGMIHKINSKIASFLMKSVLPLQSGPVRQAKQPKRIDLSKVQTRKDQTQNLQQTSGSSEGAQQMSNVPGSDLQPMQMNIPRAPITKPIVKEKKVGRNEPCPCGSGKKYKQCHG